MREVRINVLCLSDVIGSHKQLIRWAFVKHDVFLCYLCSRGKKSIISAFDLCSNVPRRPES